ncbi:MAG: histidine phosphatase family protein [Pseudohaliea sp.]
MAAGIRCLLVRHGEAAAHWGADEDPGLSALGRRQAERVAEELLALDVSGDCAILSSPRARARETAAPFAARARREVKLAPAFREIPAPVPLAERREWLRGFLRARWSSCHHPEVLAWRQGLLDELCGLDRSAVIFTHFLVINTVVAHARAQDDVLAFWPDNGSVHELAILPGGRLQVRRLGAELETVVN